MKTKISHLGRSTVSVILAVMMLLSTMLIGTVSTANAVDLTNTKFSKVYLDAKRAKYNINDTMDSTSGTSPTNAYAFNDNGAVGTCDENANTTSNWPGGSLKSEGNGIYSILVSNDATKIIFNSGKNGKQTGNLTLPPNWKTTTMIYRGSGTDNPDGWEEYSTSVKVADSVSLNASPSPVQVGTEVTLTASLNNKATDLDASAVTYKFKRTNGNEVTGSTTDGNTYKFTPATAGDYTFEVTASAENYTSVTNTVTVTATSPTTTYTVNYGVSGGNGNLTATGTGVTGSGSDVVDSGTKVTFTAQPNDGYVVDGWYSDAECKNAISGAGNNTSYEVIVNANTDVYVKFKATAIDPEYRLVGNLPGLNEWNDYNKALKFDTAESDGSYSSKEITITNDDLSNNRKYFRLIKSVDGSYKQYGPYITENDKQDVDICGFAASNPYVTYENNDKAFYFSKAGKYKIHYKKTGNTPSVWVEETTTKYYTVTVASGVSAIVNPEKAAAGETVTVTATPPSGKFLDSVTVEGENGASIETTKSGNTATFVMPSQDVTVKEVKFRDAKTCTVTFSSINETYGKVTAKYKGADFATGNTVTEGDTVTFTANANEGYTFTGWTVKVNGTSNTYTGSSLPLNITADTNVVANFGTGTLSTYYLLCGTDRTFQTGKYTPVSLIDNGNGVYSADFDAAGIKNKDYFIIFSETKDTSGIIDSSKNNNNVTVNIYNDINNNGFSFNDYYGSVSQTSGNTGSVKFSKVNIKSNSKVTGFTIKITGLDLDSKKITYSAEPKFREPVKNAVNIIAKNGTQTEKFQKMGTTKITAVDKVVFDIGNYYDNNDYVKKATAIKGNKVTVTTTVADKYKDTYYVKGFVVNGESYGIQSEPNDTGVYTLEYQIPDDVADGTNFEITPVYFLKDSQNCVTFYVEGFDGAVQKSWGNTIACYPYYEGQSETTKNNAFGAYPGQPLLYEGGKYYTQIPKSITLDSAEKKIVGMTLNNFALESVHGAISTIKENKQSYDYDDFVRIANNDYGNNIIYTFKYSTVKDNFDGLDDPTVSPATITEAEFASPKGNGWEDLTDYNHRKVDLFGNVLTDTDSKKDPLLVVSNGYFENYQGYYATEWTVYKKLEDGTYSKIAQIPSSALLLKSKDDLTDSTSDTKYENSLSDYANAYATLEASCRNTPAKITFERSIKNGKSLQGHTNNGGDGEIADRVDGRWYYSKLGEEITAKIAVEYGDTATSSFKDDPFEGDTNKTTTIGAHAYFTNEAAYGKTTCKSNIDSSKYFTFTADTIATVEGGQNYVFLGWYLLSDNKYTKLTDAKAPMTGSDTFVARYVKAPKGTVTIDHKLFSAASNPTPPTTQTPGTGSGKCYVTVKVLDENNQPIKKFDETEGSVTLDGTYIDSTKDYKLEITLKTVTSGLDEFQKFYYLAQDKQTYNSIDTGTTTTAEGKVTTVTRTVKILDSFFNHNDDGTYTFRNETGSDSIHYYSDIKEIKIPYKITFNYKPRLESDAKQYVVTGEFTSEYILNNGAAELTKEFVMSVAPYEDNFFKTIKWDKAKITINNDDKTKTAVVDSTISPRTVTVTALDVNGDKIKAYELNSGPEFTSTVVYGSLLTYKNLYGLTPEEKTEIANDREYIYVAKPEYEGKKFSYWQISTSLKKDDKSAYVTKCFSQEFNYIAYNNYYIWPVYGKSQSITGASTTLNFLDYSRNQSTDENGDHKTDRVFADFALAFDSNGIQLKTYNGDNIKVGMFLEVCGDLKSDSNGNVITDIDQYKDKPEYITTDEDLERIKTAILKNSDKKNVTYTTADGKNRWLLNKPIDIKSLDNKNRIEYYVGYNNKDNNQKKLMRAYSYVIVDNEITLCSTPYSFVNYYNVGNKTYTVS